MINGYDVYAIFLHSFDYLHLLYQILEIKQAQENYSWILLLGRSKSKQIGSFIRSNKFWQGGNNINAYDY